MQELPTNPATQRVVYRGDALGPDDVGPTPLAGFERWYSAVLAAGLAEPNAMVLATVAGDGAPSARTVLLKAVDPAGFTFFTNHGSRKGTELAGSPLAALVFPWHPVRRQVTVRGEVQRLGPAETAAYFGSRPWDSRIAAWASRQSRPGSREELRQRWAELAERWPDRGCADDVPVPEHWGGYLVRAREVEFWQGAASRLHDRLVYRTGVPGQALPAPADLDDTGAWRLERLQP